MLAWERFDALEGDPRHNLELLCRGLVQRNYGRFGVLRSRRLQPGIEFHLQLESDCDLGEAGRWFGWQCRAYSLPANHALGETRRNSISDAIDKAIGDVPGLTDFVLCLRELPRKADLDWYFQLDKAIRLHLWADEEIETRLTGEAAILRQTFFGELVLTSSQLSAAHERAIQPVKQRWVPHLHVTTSVESQIRIALAAPGSSADLREESARLETIAEALDDGMSHIDDDALRTQCASVMSAVTEFIAGLASIADGCDQGAPADVQARVKNAASPAVTVADLRKLARRLRAMKLPLALHVSALEPEFRHAIAVLEDHRRLLAASIVAVVGDAGTGKTQLGVQLTTPSGEDPAGIFMPGADLREGSTLDELAAKIPGINVSTFDELLEAGEAAGARAGCRLPILIEGLNDAERPAEWKNHLAQLEPHLRGLEHVLLVVTLRGAVRDEVIPEGTQEIELEWQETETAEAVSRYFEHYKIDSGSSRLPMWLFSNALFLRMFCEAVNPLRLEPVGVESIPTSLVAVFELYRESAAERLRARPGRPTLPPGHVQQKLAVFALALWDQNVRDMHFDDAKSLLDEGSDWDKSLVRALEEEGILFRDNREGWSKQRSAVLFDRLAGYLIADAILAGASINELDQILKDPALWEKITGDSGSRHPLSEDVFISLVMLLPRRFYRHQLWSIAPTKARDWALIRTLDMESSLLDKETVDALAELIPRTSPPKWRRRHAFDRLWELRDGVGHELNATFLDRVLRSMSVAARDLRWSEWVRVHTEEILKDLEEEERRWSESHVREDRDDLAALAIAWLLTSTNLEVRDTATRALQRFGRADPGRLFNLSHSLLDVNDPYVVERVLAATLGAATNHQMPDPGGRFEGALASWLSELASRYLGPSASSPTSHQLSRAYISLSFEFAGQLHPGALPEGVEATGLDFAGAPSPEKIDAADPRTEECDRTFGMDFENYIIGPLFEGRGNYDSQHPAFQVGLSEVRGRVWNLGWRDTRFGEVDRQIGEEQWRRHENPRRTERYGKKYGWIGYYELAGRLDDKGELRDRSWASWGVWPDIDPTFPERPRPIALQLSPWASGGPTEDKDWVVAAEVEISDQLMAPEEIENEAGPWLLVEGFLEHEDAESERRVFGFFRGVLAERSELDALLKELSDHVYLGNDFVPHSPEDIGTFGGEIPWSSGFAAGGAMEEGAAPYIDFVRDNWNEKGLPVELVGHSYNFEASRTMTNEATGYWVPSHNIANALSLRQRPGTLDLVSLDGKSASKTREAPDGFDGRLLYVRQDVLEQYAPGRALVQLAWGERQLNLSWHDQPDWIDDVRRAHADLWRKLRVTEL